MEFDSFEHLKRVILEETSYYVHSDYGYGYLSGMIGFAYFYGLINIEQFNCLTGLLISRNVEK